MLKYFLSLVVMLFLIIPKTDILAAVPVAVIPFEGDSSISPEIERSVRQILVKTNGITIVSDNQMADIMKIHEKAQIVGSSSHDISKIKIAEFLITGNITGGKLNLKAVDVNQGSELYNQTIETSGESGKRAIAKAVKEMSDKILFQGASKNTEIPSDAKPYMDLINQLANSLGGGDESSYRYIAIYSKGAFNHPDKENKTSAGNAKILLKNMRQNLLGAKLYYIGMMGESSWVYIEIVAEKAAKKTKFRFRIMELGDGTLGIAKYEQI